MEIRDWIQAASLVVVIIGAWLRDRATAAKTASDAQALSSRVTSLEDRIVRESANTPAVMRAVLMEWQGTFVEKLGQSYLSVPLAVEKFSNLDYRIDSYNRRMDEVKDMLARRVDELSEYAHNGIHRLSNEIHKVSLK